MFIFITILIKRNLNRLSGGKFVKLFNKNSDFKNAIFTIQHLIDSHNIQNIKNINKQKIGYLKILKQEYLSDSYYFNKCVKENFNIQFIISRCEYDSIYLHKFVKTKNIYDLLSGFYNTKEKNNNITYLNINNNQIFHHNNKYYYTDNMKEYNIYNIDNFNDFIKINFPIKYYNYVLIKIKNIDINLYKSILKALFNNNIEALKLNESKNIKRILSYVKRFNNKTKKSREYNIKKFNDLLISEIILEDILKVINQNDFDFIESDVKKYIDKIEWKDIYSDLNDIEFLNSYIHSLNIKDVIFAHIDIAYKNIYDFENMFHNCYEDTIKYLKECIPNNINCKRFYYNEYGILQSENPKDFNIINIPITKNSFSMDVFSLFVSDNILYIVQLEHSENGNNHKSNMVEFIGLVSTYYKYSKDELKEEINKAGYNVNIKNMNNSSPIFLSNNYMSEILSYK